MHEKEDHKQLAKQEKEQRKVQQRLQEEQRRMEELDITEDEIQQRRIMPNYFD